MKYILVHGLGQNKASWDNTNTFLKRKGMNTLCPNLFEITSNNLINYETMYEAFSNFCNRQEEKINLCGLSLGGILALEYVKKYPEKVNSIILIGTPYKIPKIIFKIQNIIFHIMPKKTFKKMGCSKKEFINLVNSMSKLNISKNLEKITCKSLILCGAKDNINIKSAKLLNSNIKNSQLKIISNSAHEVNRENPKELSKLIYDFWTYNE